MKRQKQKDSSKKKRRNKNRLKVELCVFAAGVYFFILFFIVPAVFAAAAPKKPNNAPNAPSIISFIPEGYRYDSTGKTDPFLSYLTKRDELFKNLEEKRRKELDALDTLRSMREIRTELQKFDLTQLTLSSIISDGNGVWAMVVDPMGMGHVIKKDSLIGKSGGFVDQIIRKIEHTEYGSKYIRKVIIKEPYVSKEGNLEYRLVEMDLINPYYD